MRVELDFWFSWLSRLLSLDVKYFAKNSFWVSFKNGVGMICGFFLNIAFARFLSKEAYGQYTFLLSSFLLLNFLSFPQFNLALSQSVARGNDMALFQATRVSVLGSMLASVILVGVGLHYLFLGDPTLGYGFLFSAGFFPLLFGLRGYDYFLVGKKRFDLSAQLAVAGSLLTSIALILGTLFKLTVPWLFLLYVIVNSLVSVWGFLQAKFLVSNQHTDSKVVRYGAYLTFLALSSMVVSRIGGVLLNHVQGAVVLATYSVAVIIPKAIQNLLQNFVDVAQIKVADRNHFQLVEMLRKHWWKWVLMGVGVAVCLWFMLPIVMPIIFSHKYDDAIFYAQLISITLVFFPFNTFVGTLIYVEKKHRLIALSNFFPSVPNLFLIPLAIMKYGIGGFIAINVLSWLYMTPFNLWAFLRKKDF